MRPYFCAVATTACPSRTVIADGFSQYTSLPARIASTDAGACQRSPVAMWTASMSLRASISRMSMYILQSLLP